MEEPSYRHITVEERDGVLIVRFLDLGRDTLNETALQGIREDLGLLADRHRSCPLVVDFEGKWFVFHNVLFAALIRVRKTTTPSHGTLKLCNLPSAFLDLYSKMGVGQVLPLYKSLDDAIAGRPFQPE
jgi:hypothetical protein